jgi:hypothetical protein
MRRGRGLDLQLVVNGGDLDSGALHRLMAAGRRGPLDHRKTTARHAGLSRGVPREPSNRTDRPIFAEVNVTPDPLTGAGPE